MDGRPRSVTLASNLSQLVEGARTGQESAVCELIGRFEGSARRLAEALLGDAHRAEDAVQEAFVSALNRLGELRSPEAFAAWFRQIVRTEVNRIIRKRTEASNDNLPEPPTDDESPTEVLERRELRQQIRDALAELPTAGRQTVEQYYIEGLTVSEIAAVLDVPLGTVKRRLYDARIRLRELLREPADLDDMLRRRYPGGRGDPW